MVGTPGRATKAMSPQQRRRWLVGACIVVAAIVAASVAFGLSKDNPPSRGCVEVTLAGSVGGPDVEHCGLQARRYCAGAPRMTEPDRDIVEAACRKAGIPD